MSYDDLKKIINVNTLNNNFEPFIKTYLAYVEETIAYKVGVFYGLNESIILKRLKNIKTVEKRLSVEKLYNNDVIFDGEVSGVARFN